MTKPVLRSAVCALAGLGLSLAVASIAVAAAGDDDSSSGGVRYSTSAVRGDMNRAVKLINKEDYAGAIVLLKQIVGDSPRNADAFNWLGYASRKSGKYKSSGHYYDQALKINPRHKGALEYQGELFLTLKQPDRAKNNLQKLGALCRNSCKEYRQLERAVADYQSNS